ncbi:hypothetical protein [Plastoroseomonas arctica]|uniref:Uncharacterized protein n=1 Tax=Plastoroseomonas arctica TaxID=1509237 RepID=A0AAF1K7U2_9PROT|nr:hypothetical protein [Plastoroseomonas arctica]MBR0657231.1 hypothetical protein [Plastoroseomonas arctica]
MHEQPDAADLLETARALLLAELLPALPASHAFAARMIANAMAIAARAARDATAWPAPPDAALIRAGAYDPGTPQHDEIAARLLAMARARCAVSNPRALRDD